MKFRKIEDIEAWQLARVQARDIWVLSQQGTFSKDFRLKDQINAAAGSVMDNIAEGFGRGGTREFIQFLAIARGSAQEVKSQLVRAHDRQHLTTEQYGPLFRKSEKVVYQVHHLLLQLQSASYKGPKYKRNGDPPPQNLEDILYPYGSIYPSEE
jgi:four helix bundle protein